MRLPKRLLPPALLVAFACHGSVAPTGDDGAPAIGDDTASIPFKGDTLVFPPPSTRRDRRALPSRMAEVEDAAGEEIQVAYPELDSDDHFEFSGDTVRVRFSRKVAGVDTEKDKPPIEITPAVEGKARWTSPYSLAFSAAKPFDPDTTYTMKIGEVKDDDGHAVKAWSATFRADPQLWIAGKLISYLPKPGRPRLVTIRQGSGMKVGVRPKVEMLFDQPVKPKLVAGYMKLTDDTKKTRVDTFVKVSQGTTFDGAKVAPGHVVTVAARGRLTPGHDYTLEIDDAFTKETVSMEVAEKLKFNEVNCGWRSEGCSWSGRTLKTQGREFTVEFNNRLDNKGGRIKKNLTVTPPVKNLSVWADRWSDRGKVQISGAFKPSTTYTVRLAEARDDFGWSLPAPLEFKVKTSAMPASATMPEGVQYLDGKRSRAYAVSSRNVSKLQLRVWEVDDTQQAWRDANRKISSRETPAGKPDIVIDLEPRARRDKQVTTKVDLLKHLSAGKTYVTALMFEDTDVAFKAPRPSYPSWSWASKPPVSLLTVNDDKAIVVHARSGLNNTLVHVSRLGAGDPLTGREVLPRRQEGQGSHLRQAGRGAPARVARRGAPQTADGGARRVPGHARPRPERADRRRPRAGAVGGSDGGHRQDPRPRDQRPRRVPPGRDDALQSDAAYAERRGAQRRRLRPRALESHRPQRQDRVRDVRHDQRRRRLRRVVDHG